MAKQPKKMTRNCKETLSKLGYKVEGWDLITEDNVSWTIKSKKTNKIEKINKN